MHSMNLIDDLKLLQRKAVEIAPPSDTGLQHAQPGLRGPAFFPEGFGLSESMLLNRGHPQFMVIGHNFGCVAYRKEIELSSREDDKATWRNLDSLLAKAGIQSELFFRTNWFVGLLPGDKQIGKFLRGKHVEYEENCRRLLIDQIKLIRPKAIFLLGPEVASRVHQIAPALVPWKGAKRWSDIDQSVIGHSLPRVPISETDLTVKVAALLHTSFGAAIRAVG